MPAISRGTLPQNFLDSASTGMRLPTPQPQYFFSRMAMGSRLSLAALNAGVPTVQQFVSIAGGGKIEDPGLAQLARAADAYPGAIRAVDEFGKDAGDTVKFTRDVYEGGSYTEEGRELTDDQTINTTGQAIKAEEVPITLKQFYGPTTAAGVKAPYAITNFDAKYRRNKEALSSKVTRHLGQDYVKWLDRVIRNRFIGAGGTKITFPSGSGITNGAGFVAGGAQGPSLVQVLEARKSLSDREWAPFDNGRYMCLVPTSFNTLMVGDPDYRELSKAHSDNRNQIFGYIGTVQDVDFFEVTTLARYSDDGGDDFAALAGSTIAANVTVDEALLFGPGCIGFGTASSEQQGAMGPEVRWADETNFGTVAKVIWYVLHAFGQLDDRGVQRIVWQTA